MSGSPHLLLFVVGCIFIAGAALSLFMPERVIRWHRRLYRSIRLIGDASALSPVTPRRIKLMRVEGLFWLAIGVFLVWHLPWEVGYRRTEDPVGQHVSADPTYRALQASADEHVLPVLKAHPGMGITVAVILADTSATFGYGQTSLAGSRTPDGQTLYEIGSITKLFTALLLADLAENGLVRCDSPARQLLPDSVRLPQHGDAEILLQDLASHLSGLPRVPNNMFGLRDYLDLSFVTNPYAHYTPARLYQFLSATTLATKPGTQFAYSNLGMGLLGHLLARSQKSTFEDLVVARICTPLGMNDTRISLTRQQCARLAQGYGDMFASGGFRVAAKAENWENPVLCGAGAFYANADDLSKFLAASMRPSETKLYAAMNRTQQERFRIEQQTGIGLGWMIHHYPQCGAVLWHNGGTGGYRTYLALCREQATAVVLLSNCAAAEIDRAGLSLLKDLATGQRQDTRVGVL